MVDTAEELSFSEKYPEIARYLVCGFHNMCMMFDLTPNGPLPDMIEPIIEKYFAFSDQYKKVYLEVSQDEKEFYDLFE